MRRLVVIEGSAAPAEIEAEAPVLLGRAREADLKILDETASRRHARIYEAEDGRTVLEDLDSANGVYLNGERIQGKAALFDGDEIRVAGVRLRFTTAADADRATVARTAERTAESVEAAVAPEAADPAAEAGAGEAVRRLRLVCDGAAACADASDAHQVPEILLGLLVEAFGPDRATVTVLGPGGTETVAAAHPAGASAPTSSTLRQRVLGTGEAVLVRDARDSEIRRTARSMVASRYRSTLAAPLLTSEGVLGLVAVEAEAPGRWGEEDLRALAAAALQAALALRNLRALSTARAEVGRLVERGGTSEMLGEAKAMEDVRRHLEKAAPVDSPVLVTGETGTGKELAARLLHQGSLRRKHPFVALNCAALVEGLLESELFGHEKGAFTGATETREGRIAQAGKGTLFLDEVGDLPAGLQAKLLRVLSEGTYTRVGGRKTLRLECRVIAATNRDLEAMVKEGSFRQDLYYRLAVLTVHLPPLREREGDVVLLAEAGLERLAGHLGRRPPRLARDARETLEAYPWPGNVRELMNALERALVLLEGDTITAADLPAEVRLGPPVDASEAPPPGEVATLREAERRAVIAALRATRGVKGRAAEALGISWPTLNRKIREYGLEGEVEQAKGR